MRRVVQNYGLRRGVIRYTILCDVITEQEARVDELVLLALREVGGTATHSEVRCAA